MARARRRDFSAMHPTVKPVAMVVDAIPFTTPGKWELFRQPIPERCRAELRSPRSVTCQARFTKGLRIIGAAPTRVLPLDDRAHGGTQSGGNPLCLHADVQRRPGRQIVVLAKQAY
jgi:hypothetical protein